MALFTLRNFKVAPRQTISAAVFKTCVLIRVQSGRYIWASRYQVVQSMAESGQLAETAETAELVARAGDPIARLSSPRSACMYWAMIL